MGGGGGDEGEVPYDAPQSWRRALHQLHKAGHHRRHLFKINLQPFIWVITNTFWYDYQHSLPVISRRC